MLEKKRKQKEEGEEEGIGPIGQVKWRVPFLSRWPTNKAETTAF